MNVQMMAAKVNLVKKKNMYYQVSIVSSFDVCISVKLNLYIVRMKIYVEWL
jgi:hypothetical protein